MSALRRSLDFLELRPAFTLRVVQLFWWLYIAERLFSAHWGVYQLVTATGPVSWQFNWFHAAVSPVRILVTLATARLFLEVLFMLLWPERRNARDTQSLGSELLAFLDLRPFFTRFWLHVFWTLYLLTFLYSLYLNTDIGLLWFKVATQGDWMRLLQGLLREMLWLIGVRLLIEAALKMQTPTNDTLLQMKA